MMHCGQQPGLSASFIPETSLPFLPHWGGDLAHSFERPPPNAGQWNCPADPVLGCTLLPAVRLLRQVEYKWKEHTPDIQWGS